MTRIRLLVPALFLTLILPLCMILRTPAHAQNAAAALLFPDVPGGIWYENDVRFFLESGYLDPNQQRFRPGDDAIRAEVLKLLIEPNGGVQEPIPATPSFDDVLPGSWYYGYFEEGGKRTWVRGDANCYGVGDTCHTRPLQPINRAEAAALIARTFALTRTHAAPTFPDNTDSQLWYHDSIQIAADHCVLRGDDGTGRVRPASVVNRAEIVSMIARALQNLSYNADTGTCEQQEDLSAAIEEVEQTAERKLRVTFNVNVSKGNAANYTLTGSGNAVVTATKQIDDNEVELTLSGPLVRGEMYTLNGRNLVAASGKTFSDGRTFRAGINAQASSGTLILSVAAITGSGSVPRGTRSAVVLPLLLQAPCDRPLILQGLTVTHTGSGARADIEALWAVSADDRTSNRKAFDQNGKVTLPFSPVLALAACQTHRIDVLADVRLTAGSGQHQLQIAAAGDLQTDARTIQASFPLRGRSFTIGAATTGSVTFEYVAVPDIVHIGTSGTGALLGRFQFTASNTEPISLTTVRLTQTGTATGASVVTNLRLRGSGGTFLTNAATASGNVVLFTFSPSYTLRAGQSSTIDLIGTVQSGSGKTLRYQLVDAADLTLIGVQSNRAPAVTLSTTPGATAVRIHP